MGQVYWLEKAAKTTDAADRAAQQNHWQYFEMPDLVYVPFPWTPEVRQDWQSKTHEGRHLIINSTISDAENRLERNDLLKAQDNLKSANIVLPIDLVYHKSDSFPKASNQPIERA